MRGRSSSAPAVPYERIGVLHVAARRTALVRVALALALVAAAAVELGVARGGGVSEASYIQPGATNVVVMDFSYSISGSAYRLIVNGLRRLAAAGGSVALVGFSDVAYEMLPPGTPARELEPVARRFLPLPGRHGVVFPASPWSPLEGGTRVSQGLQLADTILRRDGIRKGSVVLISDLETSSDDASSVVDAVDALKQHGYSLHLIGLAPDDASLHFFQGLVGRRSFVDARTLDRPVRTPASTALLSGRVPWSFLLAAILLALLLGLNERMTAPLDLSGVRRAA